jgi:ketosteroid isomerase-like protein
MQMTSHDIDETLRSILDKWADAVSRHQPDVVAELFSPDALFQGFDPVPGSGPGVVAAYYDKQPAGLSAQYELLSVRSAGSGTIVGFARVEFHRPDGIVPVYLTVVVENSPTGWRISHYHVSKIASA